jgi:hypothetical protein
MSDLIRQLDIYPAYGKCHTNPKKNYGVADCRVRFLLRSQKNAVQFVLSSGWYFPGILKEWKNTSPERPLPIDLGYHSSTPRYESQTPMKECDVLPVCYYDGSTLNASGVYKILLEEGSKGVWKYLEQYYYELWPEEKTNA